MLPKFKVIALGILILGVTICAGQYPSERRSGIPAARDSQLAFPSHYREWVYLSAGFDMSYKPASQMHHHMFDNVFVSPEAYNEFVKTGSWPDKTMLVLEVRSAEGRGSINQNGNYQGPEVLSVEVHFKDEARIPGKWGFFAFDNDKIANMIPASADCYSCHAAHGAVDTTFVQFYPTLLPIAKERGTLSGAYQINP